VIRVLRRTCSSRGAVVLIVLHDAAVTDPPLRQGEGSRESV